MGQIVFQGGGPGASARAKAVQHVMELNRSLEAAMQYPYHCLPKNLNQPDTAEVSVPLWDQYNGPPGALLCEVTLSEGGLDQANSHIP